MGTENIKALWCNPILNCSNIILLKSVNLDWSSSSQDCTVSFPQAKMSIYLILERELHAAAPYATVAYGSSFWPYERQEKTKAENRKCLE